MSAALLCGGLSLPGTRLLSRGGLAACSRGPGLLFLALGLHVGLSVVIELEVLHDARLVVDGVENPISIRLHCEKNH